MGNVLYEVGKVESRHCPKAGEMRVGDDLRGGLFGCEGIAGEVEYLPSMGLQNLGWVDCSTAT